MAEFDAHTRSRLEALRVGYARGLAARIGEVVQVWRRYSEGGDSAEDLRTLIRLAHNIVGSAATFGFSEVSVHAKALELRLNEIWRDADGDTAPYAAEIDAMLGEVQRCGDDAAGSLPEALPAMPEVERPAAISSPPTDKASAIYVVDDDQEVADDLAHQIACFGYEVETFADRTSVEKAIRRARPLAVVCDIVFPEGEPLGAHPFDGINNARAASESDRVLPVVYISSRDDFGARLWAARAGADGYFTKPVDVVGLIERLDALTERQLPEPIRVLVIDDSRSVGTHYTMVLEQAGIVSSVVSDPMQAIDALSAFKPDLILAAQCLYRGDDHRRLAQLADLGARHGAALVATNDVHAHSPTRRRLQDVLTCIREHCTVAEAGYRLFANAERHLKPGAEMARLFRDHPQALAHTLDIADACRFSLDELRYEYPDETVPGGRTPQAELGRLTWEGAAFRYPGGVPDKVRATLRHELELISHLDYARYFLTVHDVVRFARSQGILCQGRGSAANSAVCFCLRITEVDPDRIDLLFERFVSSERNEPPDIDVDFEHERREEVIQYIYEKYGRERAGLTATVITYRSRSAVREVCKALGLSADIATALNGTVWGWSSEGLDESHLREVGLDPADPTLCLALELSHELIGFPRHLSQHVGGFVITRGPLSEVVPIANAAMVDRTMIEWDKDDIDALGILKIDVLGLGMLTCIRKAFDLIAHHHGREFTLATVPAEDAAVYDMLCQADSVGVFQVESRAQMTMLPRLRPRHFYDLVIEVAIVRPGPIQGDMVHPYLRRRGGEEAVEIPSEELRTVLEKTCGVPLFQEQAMQIAIVAAGFTPTESDGLRRAMATFRRMGTIHTYRDKFIGGMVARDYDPDFAARCFKQIEGFGDYGFPESHAASFALLVYVSAWLKCHYPAAFACALLNSQPMGFYAPAQIVRDLKRHPLALLRPSLAREGYVESRRLADIDAGKRVRVAGLVMCRQRPGTASGVIFITLEDETGVANLIIWPRLFERARKAVLRSRLLAVIGKLEREGLVIHVVADRLIDMTDRLLALGDAKRALAQMPHAPRAAPAPAAPLLAFAAGRGDEAGGGGGGPDTRGQSRRLFPSRDFH